MMRTLLVVASLLLVLGAAAAYLCLAPSGGPFEATIPEGATFDDAATILEARGVIRSAAALKIHARWTGASELHPQPGVYRFRSGVYPWYALKALRRGPPPEPEVSITLKEGTRLEEFAAELERAGITDAAEFLRLARDPAFVRSLLGRDADSLEGYLFPDSYRFKPESSAEFVIRRLYSRFLERLEGLSRPGFDTHEFVTLASIVEREAQLGEERARIAAVFLNRLRKGMRLEADPTVRFAVGKWDTSPVLYADLDSPSPYNTYRVTGLPPGPISSVGRASLEAVASPLETDELYFVARGDGGHHFSRTYAEHLRRVAERRAR